MTIDTATPPTVLDGVDAVRAAAGTTLGTSGWRRVDRAMADAFVDATGDPDRTYLALSLTNGLLPQVVEVRGVSMGLNLGANRARFPAPLPTDARVRVHVDLTDVTDVTEVNERGSEPEIIGVQTTMTVTIEVEGHDAPACVVEVLSRFLT